GRNSKAVAPGASSAERRVIARATESAREPMERQAWAKASASSVLMRIPGRREPRARRSKRGCRLPATASPRARERGSAVVTRADALPRACYNRQDAPVAQLDRAAAF